MLLNTNKEQFKFCTLDFHLSESLTEQEIQTEHATAQFNSKAYVMFGTYVFLLFIYFYDRIILSGNCLTNGNKADKCIVSLVSTHFSIDVLCFYKNSRYFVLCCESIIRCICLYNDILQNFYISLTLKTELFSVLSAPAWNIHSHCLSRKYQLKGTAVKRAKSQKLLSHFPILQFSKNILICAVSFLSSPVLIYCCLK